MTLAEFSMDSFLGNIGWMIAAYCLGLLTPFVPRLWKALSKAWKD